MSETRKFEGTIVRVERDGFGVVEFDHVIGSNTHGIFSRTISNLDFPFGRLAPNLHVTGTAEFDEKELAMIKMIELEPVT